MEKVSAGGKLQRCRLEYLARIPYPARVLLAGEGHGRFLPALRKQFPDAEITVIDFSAGMLAQARASLERQGVAATDIEFLHQDMLTWEPPAARYDLIVTHFFLDCFTGSQVEHVVAKLGTAATAEAQWLLADFRTEEPGLKGLRARWIVRLLYGFFRIATGLRAKSLVSPDLALRKSGFTLHHQRISEWGLLKSQWWTRS